jgi:hypothetical protein
MEKKQASVVLRNRINMRAQLLQHQHTNIDAILRFGKRNQFVSINKKNALGITVEKKLASSAGRTNAMHERVNLSTAEIPGTHVRHESL